MDNSLCHLKARFMLLYQTKESHISPWKILFHADFDYFHVHAHSRTTDNTMELEYFPVRIKKNIEPIDKYHIKETS